MMQRRVQNLDLFSCQIDKGDNELGLCTCIFFDPADEDGKEPGVFITEIIEGGAVHKLGCIRVFDQIIKIGDINLIGLDEAEIVSTFKKMDDSPFQ
ncbi:neurabin-1-like [Monodelphis domestica]|nr:neurabin-1-like [Monodelphis domestica]XP_056682313.1 neurabin-1-like [Monodelphis domestica]